MKTPETDTNDANYFSLSPYGAFTIHSQSELAFTDKDYDEITEWCQNLKVSVIYISIDIKRIDSKTSKTLLQLFLKIDSCIKGIQVVTLWRVYENSRNMIPIITSYQTLFSRIKFILKAGQEEG